VMILPYIDEVKLYGSISEASEKFSADAFTPYHVAGATPAAAGRTFCVTTTSGGKTISRHFAAVQLDEIACPSYSGIPTVAAAQYKGTDQLAAGAGIPPAAYGFPEGSGSLGSPPQLAAITNYLALSATHFPLMQYGPEPNLAATTEVPREAETPNGMIVPGTGLNFKACTDGTSKTLMLCETIEPAMNCWYDGTTTWTTAINPNTVGADPPNREVSPSNPKGFWQVPVGCTTALQVGPSPNSEQVYSPALVGYGANPRAISWGPSSNHAGGVVVHGMIDTSARNINPDIDPTVYIRLITIAGGEPDAIAD
jgi:Protein of unknown function (DUF1559)